MAEKKFIDLVEEIGRDVWGYIANGKQASLVGVLHWLDEHPESVPATPAKPTITEKQRRQLEADYHSESPPSFEHWLIEFGVTVVPDPYPTNAERLTDVIETEWLRHSRGIVIEDKADCRIMADLLDEAGVTAPGGEDDEQ